VSTSSGVQYLIETTFDYAAIYDVIGKIEILICVGMQTGGKT